jgi:hypothetical protein
VTDWKGHEPEGFGDLLVDDLLTATKGGSERDYHVFLFERMLLCCKDVRCRPPPPGALFRDLVIDDCCPRRLTTRAIASRTSRAVPSADRSPPAAALANRSGPSSCSRAASTSTTSRTPRSSAGATEGLASSSTGGVRMRPTRRPRSCSTCATTSCSRSGSRPLTG